MSYVEPPPLYQKYGSCLCKQLSGCSVYPVICRPIKCPYILKKKKSPYYFLNLSQRTNFRLFQTETVCKRQFQIRRKMAESFTNEGKTLWKNEKLFVTSNFFFFYSVFKRPVLQTSKNKGLFGKGLI